jgi:hypothetical protein
LTGRVHHILDTVSYVWSCRDPDIPVRFAYFVLPPPASEDKLQASAEQRQQLEADITALLAWSAQRQRDFVASSLESIVVRSVPAAYSEVAYVSAPVDELAGQVLSTKDCLAPLIHKLKVTSCSVI